MVGKQLVRGIFFGNYFYGICAVALSMESALQLGQNLNGAGYYLCVFTGCTWFYTRAYVQDQNPESLNQRTQWYRHQKRLLQKSQGLLFLISIVTALMLLSKLRHLPDPVHASILALFPLTALLYYGPVLKNGRSLKLRNRGWLKPFLIGIIWAGTVSLYPVYYQQLTSKQSLPVNPIVWLLFLKNFFFISILCIMFDIKDYAADYNQELKTFVVKQGLRRTIFLIIIPLCLLGLGSLSIIGVIRGFSFARIACNVFPFLAAMITAYSLQRRQNILFYLIWIDGLMLLKALLGIFGLLF
jgi:hypothetical protein